MDCLDDQLHQFLQRVKTKIVKHVIPKCVKGPDYPLGWNFKKKVHSFKPVITVYVDDVDCVYERWNVGEPGSTILIDRNVSMQEIAEWMLNRADHHKCYMTAVEPVAVADWILVRDT